VLTRTVLWDEPSLGVVDLTCRVAPHGDGAEEVSTEHTVVFPRAGAFLRTRGRQRALADPTQVIFFTEGETYRFAHPHPGGDDCTSLRVPPSTLLEVARAHARRPPEDPAAPFAVPQAPATARASLLHHGLVAGLRRRALSPLAAQELALDLLDAAVGAAYARAEPVAVAAAAMPAAQRELAEAARVALAARPQSPPALDGLAARLGCSPYHLCRVFSRAHGTPMRRYLDRLRLRLALPRLAAGEPDLTGLALDLGYADHSHFSNAFRREFGLAPSAARKILQARPLHFR
jgi:AraC family transcriptional regulator